MEIQSLLDLCQGKTAWIQTHNFPDPDAIASAYGLQELLEHFNIHALLCHDGEIDKLSSTKMLGLMSIKMYPYQELEQRMLPTDMIILVDCQKNSGNTTDFIGDEVAVIDHHPTFVQETYQYADLRITGACASIIAEYFKRLNIAPSPAVASALLYGIRIDTLQFTRGVTQFDIEMYAYLFPFSDPKLRSSLQANHMAYSDLRAYGVAIDHIRIYGSVGFSYLDFECPDALVAILADFLLSLVEVDVVILYANRAGGYKFSIRSERPDVHAGELANRGLAAWGSGGGHAGMAGGFVPSENIPVAEAYFYDAVQSHFVEVLKEMFTL